FLVLLEQPRETEGESDLRRDALKQGEVALSPDPCGRAMHADEARGPVEDENRGGHHGRSVHRLHHRTLLLDGSLEQPQLGCLERLEPRLMPLGAEARMRRGLSDTDET